MLKVLVGTLVVGAALAGCGGGQAKPYAERVAEACAIGKVGATVTASTAAARGRQALAGVRSLDPPKDQAVTARALLAGLTRQQDALDKLAAGVRTQATPVSLREIVGVAGTQGDLVSPAAVKIRAPGCGRGADAFVDRLALEDYATGVRRLMSEFALRRHDPSPLRGGGRLLELTADANADIFWDLHDRLAALEPPAGLQHDSDLVARAMQDVAQPFTHVFDRVEQGRSPQPALALRGVRRGLAKVDARWRTLEARLPPVAAGSIWGGTDGAALAAAARKAQYLNLMSPAMVNFSLDMSDLATTKPGQPEVYDRIADEFAGVHVSVAALRPPPKVAHAHHLLLSGLTDIGVLVHLVGLTARTRDPDVARRLLALNRRGTAVREVRAAAKAYKAARYPLRIDYF